MTGLLIATIVLSVALVATIVFGTIKICTMSRDMKMLEECFMQYITDPDSVDVIEDCSKVKASSDFTFPDIEGF